MVLSNTDINAILDLIKTVSTAKDLDQFYQASHSLIKLLELEYVIFGAPTVDLTTSQTTSVPDFNINYPQEWVEHYQKEELWKVDPIISALFTAESHQPQSWDDLYSITPPDKEFAIEAKDFGLVDGWSCYTKGYGNLPWSILSVSGNDMKSAIKKERERAILQILSPHFHLALSKFFEQNQEHHKFNLTEREREVLRWVSEGKTSWEISQIFSITENTINFHMNNIKQKLKANTRSQAIAIAVRYGIVS